MPAGFVARLGCGGDKESKRKAENTEEEREHRVSWDCSRSGVVVQETISMFSSLLRVLRDPVSLLASEGDAGDLLEVLDEVEVVPIQ